MLPYHDPYLHEFFFGGRIVIVEGDTEFTAFSYLKLLFPEKYNDVHIIRARGKAIIPAIIKILNQFTSNYAVLHDTDTKELANGNANPAWTINSNIINELKCCKSPELISIIACKTNFEESIFDQKVNKDKPYYAISKIKTDEGFKSSVVQLLDALLDKTQDPPEDCIRWMEIEDLKCKCGF